MKFFDSKPLCSHSHSSKIICILIKLAEENDLADLLEKTHPKSRPIRTDMSE